MEKEREYQNAPYTLNLRNRKRGFPFSGVEEATRRKNNLMRVCFCPSMFLR